MKKQTKRALALVSAVVLIASGSLTGGAGTAFSSLLSISASETSQHATSLYLYDEKGNEINDVIYIDAGTIRDIDIEADNETGDCNDPLLVAFEVDQDKKLLVFEPDENGDCTQFSNLDNVLQIYANNNKSGKTSMTVTTTSGEVSRSIDIIVLNPAESLEININGQDISNGTLTAVADHSVKLTTTFKPTSTTDTVSWKVSEPDGSPTTKAEISQDGILTLKKNGEVIVEAIVNDAPSPGLRELKCQTRVIIIKNNPAVALEFINEKNEIITDKVSDINETFDMLLKKTTSVYSESGATDVIRWVSSNPTVATVDSSGKVSTLAKGTTTITAYAEDEKVFAECDLTVISKAQVIQFDSAQKTVRVDQEDVIIATETPTTANEEIIWTSSDESIATVTAVASDNFTNIQTAKVKGLKVGTCKITGTAKYSGVSTTCTISVTPKIEATGVEIYQDLKAVDTAYVYNNSTKGGITLTAKFTSESGEKPDETVAWMVSGNENELVDYTINGDSITIRGNALASGSVTVTASAKNNLLITKSCTVNILKTAASVSMSEVRKSVNKGAEFSLSATISPDNTDEKIVKWTSSNEAVATVDQNGNVKALSTGSAVIAVETTNGLKAICNVSVHITAGIEITPTSETLAKGKTKTLTAKIINQEGGTSSADITWTSSDESVATVDSSGTVTAVNVGTAVITAASGTKSATSTITVTTPILDAVIAEIPEQIFDATLDTVEPDVTISYEGRVLTEGTDYTLSYPPANAANKTYTIYVTGIGYFTGTDTVKFKIVGKNVSDSSISISQVSAQQYTSYPIKPELTVMLGNIELVNGSDYTIEYSDNTEVGTASVTITGKGNYSGTATVNFDIVPVVAESITVGAISDVLYTGSAIMPKPYVKYDSKTLTLNKDYTLEYSNNINAGTAYIDIKFMGNYYGSKRISFNITSIPISGAPIASIDSVLYTGSDIEPVPVVSYKINGEMIELRNDVDYYCTYVNNVNVGQATLMITGIGNYSGTKKTSFKILTKDIGDSDVEIAEISAQPFSGIQICPDPIITYAGKRLIENYDYTLTYRNNFSITNDGKKANITVTGQNNFEGSVEIPFDIVERKVTSPAKDVSVTDEDGDIIKDTFFVDKGDVRTFDVKLLSNSGSCDDVLLAQIVKESSTTVADGYFTELSDDGLTATIALNGVTKGTTKLEITSISGEVFKSFNVVVLEPATSMKIMNGSIDITGTRTTVVADHKLQLEAVLNPTSTTDSVLWSVSDTTKAEITTDGLLTAKENGTITVTAKIKPSETSRRGMSQTTTVTIIKNNPVTFLELDYDAITLKKGDKKTLQLTKVGTDTSESSQPTDVITWKSSDTKVATVDASGKITAVAKGEAVISAHCENPDIVATCNVSVSTPAESLTMDFTQKNVFVDTVTELSLTEMPITADETLEWTSSDPSIIKIEGSTSNANIQTVSIKALKAGTCKITASTKRTTPDDSTQEITQVSVTCTITAIVCSHEAENEWVITKPATLTEKGSRNLICPDCGKIIKTEEIDKLKAILETCTVSLPNLYYAYANGTAITPKPVVKCGDEVLVEDVDYTITYTNNKKIGTSAKATIVGMGRFTGETSVVFTVESVQNNKVRQFVQRNYKLILGRDSDPHGLEDWTQQLLKKKNTAAGVVSGFIFSDEYKSKNKNNEEFVEMMYNVMMDRGSDPAGKASWVKNLNDGLSRNYVLYGFINSIEFSDICNSFGINKGTVALTENRDKNPNVTAFVSRLYNLCLGRNADIGGLNAWTGMLLTETATKAVEGFVFSQEYKNKNTSNSDYVEMLYNVMMDRGSDPAGKASWVNLLSSGTYSREQVLAGFINSQEFTGICAAYGIRK